MKTISELYKWVAYVDEQPDNNSGVIVAGLLSGERITIDARYDKGKFITELYQAENSNYIEFEIHPLFWLKAVDCA